MSNGSFYFPGFAQTHSFVLNGAYLKKDSLNKINFSSGFPFSRGYQSVILYLLRVRANLFYDDTEAKDFNADHTSFTASFRSAGTEINFDTKWWNEVNVSFGFRYSRLLDKDLYGGQGYNRWEIILP